MKTTKLTPKIAAEMAVMIAGSIGELEGVLFASDDSVERTRLENALSGMRSLYDFYLLEAMAK